MKKHVFVTFLVVLFSFTLQAQTLIINEVVAKNATGYTNSAGKTPDWIELKNVSAAAISLADYQLSNNEGRLQPWQLPNISLAAGATFLVEASNPELAVAQWSTIKDKGDTWKYQIPIAGTSLLWKNKDFDDSGWPEGASGFGYEKGDVDTTLSHATRLPDSTISVFIRTKFNITNIADISDAVLHMDVDDGFVAYLNGVEIARVGMFDEQPAFDALGGGKTGNFQYGKPIDVYAIADIAKLLQVGENVLAIQIHNSGAGSSDFTAIPIFSVGYKQVQVAAKPISQFVNLSNSNNQANFKISAEDDEIYLFKNSVVVDSLKITKLPVDVSKGRENTNIQSVRYFATPTPNANNSGASYPATTIDAPIFSQKGGVIKTNTKFDIYSPEANSEIYYTTDGTEPTTLSTKYTASITISSSMQIKAKVIKPGYYPSESKTVSFIYLNRTQTLPIVSLTVKNEDFFDWNTGIYVAGPKAKADDPHYGANYWQDWEKPCHFQIIGTDGKTVFEQQVGVKVAGNWSRMHAQKSLKFYPRSEYGESTMKYQFFKDKPVYEYESILLRNSGGDFNNTQMRDGMFSVLAAPLCLARQAYTPNAVYINGEYYGIQNFRDKINAGYLSATYGVAKDSISLMDNHEVKAGSGASYFDLYDYMTVNDLSQAEHYNHAKEVIDIDDYIKYNVVEMFVVNGDWPGNNVKRWKSGVNGKWRHILYDLDFGFGLWNLTNVNDNMLTFATDPAGPGWPNPDWSTFVLRSFMKNQEFKNLFMNYTADILNTRFLPDTITHVIDSLYNNITEEITYHGARWGEGWLEGDMRNNVAAMKTFGEQRGDIMRTQTEDFFNTNGSYNLTLQTQNGGKSKIKLNSISPANYPWNGKYFKNVPITLTALPAPGYKFVSWSGASSSTNATITLTVSSATTVTAIFTNVGVVKPDIVITEVNYKSSNDAPASDWIELFNNNNTPQDISGWKLTPKFQYQEFVFPQGTTIPAKSFIVVCRDSVAFKAVYSSSTIQKVGNMPFALDPNSDIITVYDIYANAITSFTYHDNIPWPKKSDGYGYTIQRKLVTSAANDASNWFAYGKLGTPGAINTPVNLTPDRTKVVINEINYQSSESYDAGDWIELYNMSDIDVPIGEWIMRDAKDGNIFLIPEQTSIPAKSYVVFCAKPDDFAVVYPNKPCINTNLGFNSITDGIRLYDQYEYIIDSVMFSSLSPWDNAANGSGKTLALTSPELDNSKSVNWKASKDFLGTPGEANTDVVSVDEVTQTVSVYPIPADKTITIDIALPARVEVYNMFGKVVLDKVIDSKTISVKDLPAGMYILKTVVGNITYTANFIKE